MGTARERDAIALAIVKMVSMAKLRQIENGNAVTVANKKRTMSASNLCN